MLIRSLQGVRGRFSKTAVIAAYNANVRSILEYGSVIWAGAADTHLLRLERVQHKFLAFLAGTRRDRFNLSNYDELCLSYRMNKLVKRRMALDLSFMHGVLTGRVDSVLLVSNFSLRIPARTTRNADVLFVPSCRIDASMSALYSRLPRVFNAFLRAHPSFDLFYDSKSTMLRTFYASV